MSGRAFTIGRSRAVSVVNRRGFTRIVVGGSGGAGGGGASGVTSINGDTGVVDHVTPRIVIAAGDDTMLAADNVVIINKTTPAPTVFNMVSAAGRIRPVTVINAMATPETNIVTVDPNGAQTIIGQVTWTIEAQWQSVTFSPLPDGSGWFIK